MLMERLADLSEIFMYFFLTCDGFTELYMF